MMNITVSVNDAQLRIKEYNGQRVVTFKDIDAVHDRPDGTAGRNFRDNKSHLVEGVDYFRRNSSEAKTEYNVTAPNGLTLLTESGYLMLVKSFTDELAWQVQRQLVNTYFHYKEEVPKLPEQEYEYVEKRWNGQIVASIRDIHEIWKDISRYSIRYAVKQYLTPGIDYLELRGLDLARFKRENLLMGNARVASSLYVVTYSGLKKLAKIIGDGDFEPFRKFEVKEIAKADTKTTAAADVANSGKARQHFESIRAKTTALNEILEILNGYGSQTEKAAYMQSLTSVAGNLYSECMKLGNV